MSLLNQMLNDLAKQKPRSQSKMLPVVFMRRRLGLQMGFLILGILLISLLLTLFFITRQSLLAPAHVSASALNINKAVKEVASQIAAVKTQAMPLMLLSHVTPLPSFSSQIAVIPAQIASEDGFPVWHDVPDGLAQAAVNKIYARQTLEQWHDAQLAKAQQAIEEGDDSRAIALLQAVLFKIPQSIMAREHLAILYLSLDDRNKASEVINDGLGISAHAIPLLTMKARLMIDSGQAASALKLLLPERPSMAQHPDFYAMLAAALESEGRIREAGSLYKGLLTVDPTNAQYWLGYAIALENDHEANQALEAYSRASAIPDADPAVRAYAEHRLKTLQG